MCILPSRSYGQPRSISTSNRQSRNPIVLRQSCGLQCKGSRPRRSKTAVRLSSGVRRHEAPLGNVVEASWSYVVGWTTEAHTPFFTRRYRPKTKRNEAREQRERGVEAEAKTEMLHGRQERTKSLPVSRQGEFIGEWMADIARFLWRERRMNLDDT